MLTISIYLHRLRHIGDWLFESVHKGRLATDPNNDDGAHPLFGVSKNDHAWCRQFRPTV
jgi:hypothetical protein